MQRYVFFPMNSIPRTNPAADTGLREPEMARLLRAWEHLQWQQKEDLIYLAQSMANRNRRERRNGRKPESQAA